MDTTLFSMKRVYWKSVAHSRAILKKYGLTPARFDVLYAIYNHRDKCMHRIDLVPAIGTVKSNVWRLCDALESLGLAFTDYDPFRIIDLTKRGRALVELILRETRAQIAEITEECAKAVEEIDGRSRDTEPPTAPKSQEAAPNKKVGALVALLRALRQRLRDVHCFDVYATDLEARLQRQFLWPRLGRYWGTEGEDATSRSYATL